MLRPDDPELIDCTCAQRRLSDREAVFFILPGGKQYIAFARDCPEHGAFFDDEPVAPETVN